ncbi:type II secretion system protein M [Aestuariibacter sp. AA17]|uniref:Type II secretion system protein M n=1 Tax=Fluctibacter corallii TaxID=2984329 RepID=A0ABT3AAV3_9ALTE|nr:type II secretion system protein M [Aestuariibacter sp. AA17]MCV2885790.1 type II secretion system protein M [Aestuariibacter sp. AA17]
MTLTFQRYADYFYALSLRERSLIMVAGGILILLVGFVFLLEPALIARDKRLSEIEAQSQALSALEQRITQLNMALATDPDAPIKSQIQQLDTEEVQFTQRLAQFTDALVPPESMAGLLETVLTETHDVTLVSMRSLPPVPLLSETEVTQTSSLNVYQHGMTLRVEGQYFAIQRYLAKLQALPWQFYWQGLEYEVTRYPLAQVSIELYTLSMSNAFIGVAHAP